MLSKCCCPTMLMEIYRHSVYGLTKYDTGTNTVGRALFTSSIHPIKPATLIIKVRINSHFFSSKQVIVLLIDYIIWVE